MNLEIHPFPGATFAVAKIGKLTIMNFAYSDVPQRFVSFHYLLPDGGGKMVAERGRWDPADTKTLLKLLHRAQSDGTVYVVTAAPIIPFLLQTKGLLFSDRKRRPVHVPRSSDHASTFRTTVRQVESPGYVLDCKCFLRPLSNDPAYSIAITLMMSRSNPIQWLHEDLGPHFDYHLTATSETALLRYIEEALTGETADITPKVIQEGLLYIYLSPLIGHRFATNAKSNHVATQEWIETNRESVAKAVEDYSGRLQELIKTCHCQLTLPPDLTSEEVYRLVARVEVTIVPRIIDQELLITRGGETDLLFDKLYRFIEEEQQHPTQLKFTYGALLDVGQIFTYGECAELASRARVLAGR